MYGTSMPSGCLKTLSLAPLERKGLAARHLAHSKAAPVPFQAIRRRPPGYNEPAPPTDYRQAVAEGRHANARHLLSRSAEPPRVPPPGPGRPGRPHLAGVTPP